MKNVQVGRILNSQGVLRVRNKLAAVSGMNLLVSLNAGIELKSNSRSVNHELKCKI
jgi:hypothetical protein